MRHIVHITGLWHHRLKTVKLFLEPICVRFRVPKSPFLGAQFKMPPTGGIFLTPAGFANYKEALTSHPTFKQTFVSSMGNMVLDVPLIIFFSLFIAIILNRDFKGRSFVRAIFFLPVIMNSDAIKETLYIGQQLLNGGLNSMSSEISSGQAVADSMAYYVTMLQDLAIPTNVMEYLVGAVSRINDIITGSGVQIVIFIAALQSVPSSLYEVARIEGATAYETFWKITFPMVMPHIITNLVYTIVARFSESEVLKLAYEETFTNREYGVGNAFTVMSVLTVFILLATVVGLIQKRTFYYN